MNIASVPAQTIPATTIPATVITINDNWPSTYVLQDNPTIPAVSIFIPPTAGTAYFIFTLWGTGTSVTYSQAQQMNGGLGYGNSDLLAGISGYLAGITVVPSGTN